MTSKAQKGKITLKGSSVPPKQNKNCHIYIIKTVNILYYDIIMRLKSQIYEVKSFTL